MIVPSQTIVLLWYNRYEIYFGYVNEVNLSYAPIIFKYREL